MVRRMKSRRRKLKDKFKGISTSCSSLTLIDIVMGIED
jgi:hypothetical protein